MVESVDIQGAFGKYAYYYHCAIMGSRNCTVLCFRCTAQGTLYRRNT